MFDRLIGTVTLKYVDDSIYACTKIRIIIPL